MTRTSLVFAGTAVLLLLLIAILLLIGIEPATEEFAARFGGH